MNSFDAPPTEFVCGHLKHGPHETHNMENGRTRGKLGGTHAEPCAARETPMGRPGDKRRRRATNP